MGPVLACGEGVDALKAALEQGKPGSDYRVPVKGLGQFVSPRVSRRMDQFTRMAVLAAHLAIQDAGLEKDETLENTTGIVLGTALGPQRSTFSYLDGMIDDGDNCVSSFSFTSSVHNTAAAQISLTLGIRGPARTITAFGYTAGAALGTAVNWLEHRTVQRVLLVLGEETSGVLNYAIEKMGGGSGPLNPFASHCSYRSGEGCVAFVLENSDTGYCAIESLDQCLTIEEAAKQAASRDMLFCAAAGNAEEFDAYRRIGENAPLLGAYSALYGSLFTGMAVELAIAALSLREKVIYPVPVIDDSDRKKFRLPGRMERELKKVAIASVCARDRITFARLRP
jgi:3-oxoacyl-[acyl-carrier-protein] synthase II